MTSLWTCHDMTIATKIVSTCIFFYRLPFLNMLNQCGYNSTTDLAQFNQYKQEKDILVTVMFGP